MSFDFDISDELRMLMKKLQKKDKTRLLILNKKIKEIISSDATRYKNLRYGLNDYKRVHIDRSFVLVFKVDIEKNHILFERLRHHGDIY